MTRASWACGLILAMTTSGTMAAEWGSIEGQFVAAGPIEVPAKYEKGAANKNPEVCALQAIPDDTLVVNQENRGIANVFIYLTKAPADVHPDLKAVPTAKVMFDQKGCRYLPHSMIVRVGQPVNCISSDGTSHNVHTIPVAGQASNFIVQPNDQVGQEIKFAVKENLPVKVVCDIHPWMDAYWFVAEHPYVAMTDADGKFKMENLPAGDHVFRVWHERQGYLNREYKVTVAANKSTPLAPVTVPVEKLAIKK